MPPPGPDPTKRAPRPVVAALIGAEAGAVAGPLALAGVLRVRRGLVRRGIRQQLREGHPAPDG